MKPWLFVFILLSLSYLLVGDNVEAKPPQQNAWNFNAWLFYEIGTGSIKDLGLLAAEGGLGLEYDDTIRATIYKVIYGEAVEMFDVSKYEFIGKGAQIGFVWRYKNLKLSPSVGYEYGDIRIGEGAIIQELLGYDYESYRYEAIHYIPVSLNAQVKIGSVVGVSLRMFTAINPKYPVTGVSLGLCLGKM